MTKTIRWNCDRCPRTEYHAPKTSPLGWSVLKLVRYAPGRLPGDDSPPVVSVQDSRQWDLCHACSEEARSWASSAPPPPTPPARPKKKRKRAKGA